MQPIKWDSKAKRTRKRLTKREKVGLLERYEAEMQRGQNREKILEEMAEEIGVTSQRQVERILAQAKQYREKKEKHFRELSIAALTLAANFETYLNNIGPSLDKIGDFVYGLDEDIRYGMGMRKVDKFGALNLLRHLKSEFPELANVTDWADLTPGGTINDNLIVQLQLKGNQRHFSGKCPACPR